MASVGVARATSAIGALAPRVVLQRLRPAHAPAALRCIGETFGAESGGAARDPFTAAFNFDAAAWGALCGSFVARAAASPAALSVVAVNAASGSVEGLMVCDDWARQPPALYRTGLPLEWHATRALFRKLYTAFDASPLAPRGEGATLHCLYFTCVRPQAQGAGVMKALWRATIDAARDAGFESVVASSGSAPVRAVLHEHLGFEEVQAVDFADHARESGVEQFAGLPPQFDRLSLNRRRLPSDLYI